MHTGSRLESTNGDFLARLPSPHDVEGIQETLMRQWVELHARRKDQPVPTPFLSVTTQLLRAISLAEHFRMWGHNDIRIVLIDGWSLLRNTSTAVNPLRRRLGLNKAGTSTCERYIWAKIPRSSVLSCWQWELIRPAFLTLIPSLECNEKCFKRLVQNIRIRKRGFTISSLVELLVVELRMCPSSMLTKRTAIEIISWTKGQRIFNTSSWNIALNSPKSKSSNWGWIIQHLDRQLFSRYLGEIALVLAKTTLAHSLYSSFDHWWYGREEAEMVFWAEGRQDECIENGTSCEWFDLSYRTSRS